MTRRGVRRGGLDVLVNNAGVFTPHPITDVSYEHWQDEWRAAACRAHFVHVP